MKMLQIPGLAVSLSVFALLGACAPSSPDAATAATSNNVAATPAAVERAAPEPAPVVCSSCGVVRSITAVSQQGQATGAGAVIGAIVGGVAGNQVGGGSGKDIATAAGAIGGALLGNSIEKNRSSLSYYEVVIDMDGGGQQFITVPDASGINPGSLVSVQGGNISLR